MTIGRRPPELLRIAKMVIQKGSHEFQGACVGKQEISQGLDRREQLGARIGQVYQF